jgi:hypothetical protein
MPNPTRSTRSRLGAAAGLLGATAALTVATGAGPVPSIFQLSGSSADVSGPCDEVEHAGDPSCAGSLVASGDDDSTSTTVEGSTTSTVADGEVRTIDAGDAGSLMVSVDNGSLLLLTASPNQGWSVEVERASGPEVEVTFRSGTTRVDANVELEDGQIRVRVRTRDDATDADSRVETSTPSTDDRSDDTTDDDSSGPGSDDDAIDDTTDDDSSGRGSDDDAIDDTTDDDSSGPGSDDDAIDDTTDDTSDDDSSGPGSGSDDSDDSSDSGSGSDDSSGHD